MPNQEPYCGVTMVKFGEYYYENIFRNIFIPICLVGMILNLLNMLVFTRKTMNSPPNLILAHLAFVDFLILLSIMVDVLLDFDTEESYVLTLVYWYNSILLCTFHFISAFLTVQLAAWRYIAVVHPLKERHWCNKKITRNVVISGYVVCSVLYGIPDYLSFDIEASNMDGKTHYIYTTWRHPIMILIRNIVYGLLMKLLPSVVLVVLTSRIAVTLLARKTRRQQLTSSTSPQSNIQNAEMRQQTHRSTATLLAVAALYFTAEFPKGILWVLRIINKYDWNSCYYSLVLICVTITLINVSITFLVYYTLCEQ